MPNAPKTPTRVVRIPTELWDAAGDAAARAGTDRSAVIRELLAWYSRQPGAKLPKRPDAGE